MNPRPVSNVNRVYGGLEVQLPWRLFLIGEVTQRAPVAQRPREIPWAGGIQWRGRNLGCSLAVLQNGGEVVPASTLESPVD